MVSNPSSATQADTDVLRGATIVFAVILLASLFGILTRPMGFLAAIWPANAILLGIMVRYPGLSTRSGWAAAFAGYIAADLVTGGEPLVTVLLTIANMAGAYSGYVLFSRLGSADRRLRRPHSIIYLFAICCVSATFAALFGGWIGVVFFGRELASSFAFWFTSEFVNAVMILPIMLTAPRFRPGAFQEMPAMVGTFSQGRTWFPALALMLSVLLSLAYGGEGSIAYAVPALLWCALSYTLFTTAILTSAFSVAMLTADSAGLMLPATGEDHFMVTISIRVAISLIALGPLAVASVNEARNDLVLRLKHAVDHDGLTGALVRRTFIDRARKMVTARQAGGLSAAVLMIDVDHFKTINDSHGHATGDRVLARVAAAVATNLRPEDVFGRLGGEEFGIVSAISTRAEALAMAERIRAAVGELSFESDSGLMFKVSISGGLSLPSVAERATLESSLSRADKALYEAKSAGRNRTVVAPTPGDGSRKKATAA